MDSPIIGSPGNQRAELAAWNQRFLARGLDSALTLWAWAVVAVEFDGRLLRGDLLGRSVVEVPRWRLVAILALVLLAIEVLPTVIFGRSLGKAVTDLRIVGPATSLSINPFSAAIRTAVLWAPLMFGTVGFVIAGLNVGATVLTNRGVHDRLARTAVVHIPITRPERLGPLDTTDDLGPDGPDSLD